MSYLFFDVILAVVLALTLFQGYRKGFVLTLCGFLAVFVALYRSLDPLRRPGRAGQPDGPPRH